MLRLLTISPVTWPVRGGLSTVVHKLGEAAAEVGDYNEIVRTVGSPSEEGVGEFSSTLCLPKQNSRWWSLGGLRVLILQIRAIFMLRKVIREKHIDIIHLHFPSSSLWPVVYAGAPLIVTYHGSDGLWLNNSSQK